MLVQKSTLHLAKGMVGIAISAMLMGALLIGLMSWTAAGWVMVAYGILVLYLAYHVNAAPCLDEPDPDTIHVRNKSTADYQQVLDELTAEALANSRI
jgi:hypothetical protein